MSDGRDFLRNMWTRTTTNDTKGASYEAKLTTEHFDYSAERVDSQIKAMPDQKLHRNVSFLKSAVRIVGFGACWWSLDIGLTLLILAEVVGIYEEMV